MLNDPNGESCSGEVCSLDSSGILKYPPEYCKEQVLVEIEVWFKILLTFLSCISLAEWPEQKYHRAEFA